MGKELRKGSSVREERQRVNVDSVQQATRQVQEKGSGSGNIIGTEGLPDTNFTLERDRNGNPRVTGLSAAGRVRIQDNPDVKRAMPRLEGAADRMVEAGLKEASRNVADEETRSVGHSLGVFNRIADVTHDAKSNNPGKVERHVQELRTALEKQVDDQLREHPDPEVRAQAGRVKIPDYVLKELHEAAEKRFHT